MSLTPEDEDTKARIPKPNLLGVFVSRYCALRLRYCASCSRYCVLCFLQDWRGLQGCVLVLRRLMVVGFQERGALDGVVAVLVADFVHGLAQLGQLLGVRVKEAELPRL
jgi:putative component of membrane protein insertase Oxa1/YidC/SpoIIIJ protein YidD